MSKIAELEARQALNALKKWYAALHAARKPDLGVVPLDVIYDDAANKTAALLDHALEILAESQADQLAQAGYEDHIEWKQDVIYELFDSNFPGVLGEDE